MMATEPSILNGHRFGPFRRCFSRFTIGVEQTCDDYIAPFWQLPKSLLFIRTAMIISAITVISATLTTLFSMSCIYQGQMKETQKTWLRLLAIILRLTSGTLVLLCISLYATMVIHDDLRAADIQTLEPNTQPFRYEVYNLWGRCIWIGWAESCSEILLNLYSLYLWMDPASQAEKIKKEKALKKKRKLESQQFPEQQAYELQQFHPENEYYQNDPYFQPHNVYQEPIENQQYYESTIPEYNIDFDLLDRSDSTVLNC